MAYSTTEDKSNQLEKAAKLAMRRVQEKYGDQIISSASYYDAAANSLGTGIDYDENGDPIEPEGGFWKTGMTVGSAPIRG